MYERRFQLILLCSFWTPYEQIKKDSQCVDRGEPLGGRTPTYTK